MASKKPKRDGLDVPPLESFVNQWQRVTLPNGLVVRWIVEPVGQEAISKSDQLTARFTLSLPAGKKNDGYTYLCLHESLRFGARLQLLGERLIDTWGNPRGDERARDTEFSACTWAEAFRDAYVCGQQEIEKLSGALATRLAYLTSDGHEFAAAKNLLDKIQGD